MNLKIAVSGKGGAGKSTISALLARELAKKERVLLIDADPVPTTARLLGIDRDIAPLARMTSLIEEREGVDESRKVFNLNPKVDDIVDRFGVDIGENLKLLVLGTMETAKTGCFCPENAFLRAFLRHITGQSGILILDMEAGIEHLTRGTTKNVDILLIVTEPTRRAMEVVAAISKQAQSIGIGREKMLAVVNKSRDEKDAQEARSMVEEMGLKVICALPYDEEIASSERKGSRLACSATTGREVERLAAIIVTKERAAQ